jgi:hypothetical protein
MRRLNMKNEVTGKKTTAAKRKSKENISPVKTRPVLAKKARSSSNPSSDELLKQCKKQLAEQKKLSDRQKKEIENLKKLLADEKMITSQQNNEIESLENDLVKKLLILNGDEKW